MLRHLLALLLSAALIFSATLLQGCALFGGPKPRSLSEIVDSGTLRVGMSGEQPPLNMVTRSGELIGLEVALINVLAENMGVEAILEQRPFHQLLDALEAGEVDLVMSGMAITPQRNVRVAFVGPYFISGKSVLTRSEQIAAAKDAAALNHASLRMATLAGSTSTDFVQRVMPKVELVTTETLDQAIHLVIDGQVDALLADSETCHFAKLRYKDAGLFTLETPITIEPMGIALSQDTPALANILENYLGALEGAGVIQRVRDYWFENDAWLEALR